MHKYLQVKWLQEKKVVIYGKKTYDIFQIN